ncbi:MAG: peptidase S41 [Thermoanaerobaculia bacterium]|nr:peptidase S41 [Thermoanaerobaculia bacterium]
MRSMLLSATLALVVVAPLPAQIDARMLRWPDVSATEIAFVYAGDVWLVPKTGGVARRLSTPTGEESSPRFSPDGRQIAFTGNYDGNSDLYVIPTTGGLPTRLTHHPDAEIVLDWFPDGDSLLFASGMESGKERFRQFYRIPKQGGLPEKLPIAYGEVAALSADGQQLAYLPFTRDARTWKRYRGGMAPDIWLFDLETYAARNLTASDANDSQPMWHGDVLYFLSDRDANKRYNLWVMSLATGELRQLTHFDTLDVHFPAIGPQDIVFECGGRLYRFELATEQLHEVKVDVLTDRATQKPRVENVAGLIQGFDVSPAGKRAIFEARGEVFNVPAEHGVVRNLTRSSGVAERFPAWSPDGETVAYWSDRSGEYELTLRAADGGGAETVATALGPGFRYALHWSPDSRKLAFADQEMRIWLHDRDTGKTTEIDRGLWLFEGALRTFHVSWSRDSRWLAYSRGVGNRIEAVFLYDTHEAALHQLTTGFYNAALPAFDPDGKYLYLLWSRSFEPIFSDFELNMVWANSTRLAAVTLRKDVASPLVPRDDTDADKKKEEEKNKKEDKKHGEKEGDAKAEPRPVEIDLEGFESRLVVLPPAAGNYWNLRAVAGKVLYQRFPRTGTRSIDDDDRSGDVVLYDLEKREEKTIVEGVDGFALAAGGDKLLVQKGEDFSIVDVAPEQKLEKKLATATLETTIDPVAEWRQIFVDAWRFERDYFYDPNLHGVDWQAMRRRYGALLEDAVTRWDVNYVLGELIGELSASHTYRGGGDQEDPERRSVGLLGAGFTLENGAFRLEDIVDVAPWESEVRSPLRQPGVNVAEGDYLLAVDGVPLAIELFAAQVAGQA